MSAQTVDSLAICVDDYIDDEGYDAADAPSLVNPRNTSRNELALAKYKLWDPGQLLRIRFLDGDSELHEMVEREARQWLEFANLKIEFGNFADADIRVTFIGSGYRSLVGTDASRRFDPRPTMTLGGFTKFTEPAELRRVVLHEFGHAIGCVHEQSSPNVEIPWDKDKVYAYYKSPRIGWDKEKVDRNVLKRYTKRVVDATEFHDTKSIMQYPVPNELTIGDYEIGWNTELSETDKIFIAKMYPK